MSGSKRKDRVRNGDSPLPKNQGSSSRKRAKLSHDFEAETVTDSDPIEESDTTSQSGDDDGVSWASDDASIEDDQDGASHTENNAVQSTKPSLKTTEEKAPADKRVKDKTTANSELPISLSHNANLDLRHVVQRGSREAEN